MHVKDQRVVVELEGDTNGESLGAKSWKLIEVKPIFPERSP